MTAPFAVAALEAEPSFALLGPGYSADGRWTLVTPLEADAGEARVVFARFEDDASQALRFGGVEQRLDAVSLPPPAELTPQVGFEGYAEAVESIREAIARGDVYQVCLTLKATLGPCAGSALLARLCARGIPRFAAWVRVPGGVELVSGSPELLLEVEGRTVRTQPMKGTALSEDALAQSDKDRAELAMITDLLRNDLTPICRPRTVRVLDPRRLVRLPYAVQTVSHVEGELLDGVGPLEALAAVHPGGSVTGAPKRAALEHLRALERGPRGAYCGALGLCTPAGAVFSLLIRTAERRPGGWEYGVGSGVVHDSQATLERAELELKLGALRGAG